MMWSSDRVQKLGRTLPLPSRYYPPNPNDGNHSQDATGSVPYRVRCLSMSANPTLPWIEACQKCPTIDRQTDTFRVLPTPSPVPFFFVAFSPAILYAGPFRVGLTWEYRDFHFHLSYLNALEIPTPVRRFSNCNPCQPPGRTCR